MADETGPLPEITVNKAWCKACGYCVEFCPTDVLAMKGIIPVVVNIEACTACKLCDYMCPDFAITVRGEPPKKRKKKAASGG
jgi:2-oxoglutarate ferredoxin oxidoreductase subunit delta